LKSGDAHREAGAEAVSRAEMRLFFHWLSPYAGRCCREGGT